MLLTPHFSRTGGTCAFARESRHPGGAKGCSHYDGRKEDLGIARIKDRGELCTLECKRRPAPPAQERNGGADQASARVEDHTHRAATATELKRESFSGAIARPAGEASAPCFNSLTSLGARQMLSSS
jgi:hypothetical protein